MKPEFSQAGPLLDWIEVLAGTRGHILIDGFAGAGKSTLAAALADHGFKHFSVDDFVVAEMSPNKSRYIDVVDLGALRAGLLKHPWSVIDGVTGLDLADALGVPLRAHVYVKQLNERGEWYHADEVLLENDLDSIAPPSQLLLCQRRYHVERQPHEICDAVFVRQDDLE